MFNYVILSIRPVLFSPLISWEYIYTTLSTQHFIINKHTCTHTHLLLIHLVKTKHFKICNYKFQFLFQECQYSKQYIFDSTKYIYAQKNVNTKYFLSLIAQTIIVFHLRRRKCVLPSLHVISNFGVCDEWGEAKSRGNGGRPVELMIMNDTCATHRSRVPQRSCRRKRRSEDERGPGLDFILCIVCNFTFCVYLFY